MFPCFHVSVFAFVFGFVCDPVRALGPAVCMRVNLCLCLHVFVSVTCVQQFDVCCGGQLFSFVLFLFCMFLNASAEDQPIRAV